MERQPIRRTFLLRAYAGRAEGSRALERITENLERRSAWRETVEPFPVGGYVVAFVTLEHPSARSLADTRDLTEKVQAAVFQEAGGSVITWWEIG